VHPSALLQSIPVEAHRNASQQRGVIEAARTKTHKDTDNFFVTVGV
jgi:hypothetical protein